MQKNLYDQAEVYAQSALFLEESLDNTLLLIKIYQAGKQMDKFRDALARALLKFPQDPELLRLSGR
jgi:hypothetical protein